MSELVKIALIVYNVLGDVAILFVLAMEYYSNNIKNWKFTWKTGLLILLGWIFWPITVRWLYYYCKRKIRLIRAKKERNTIDEIRDTGTHL